MDLLTHTLTGLAAGTVIASFSKERKHQLCIVMVSTFGGALPDFDAISLWSGFDSTAGAFFNLSESGHDIYYGKHAYSHHGALHSITLAVMLPLIFMLVRLLFGGLTDFWARFKSRLAQRKLHLVGFSTGFTLHLLEDMPTPSSSWGGVNFFWPSSEYIGGWGKIWWWNNYDLFLLVVCVVFINLTILAFRRMIKVPTRYLTSAVFVIFTLLFLNQISNRNTDFNSREYKVDYPNREAFSKKQQRDILGDRLYHLMERFDDAIKLSF